MTRSEKNARNREWRRQRIAAGICEKCPNLAEPGRTRCVICKELDASRRDNPKWRKQHNERMKRFLNKRKQKGICTQCKRPAMPGYNTCPDHREAKRRKRADQLAERLESGICTTCNRKPCVPKRRRCKACLKKHRETQAAYKVKRKNLGLCQSCSNPAPDNSKFCDDCKQYRQNMVNEKERQKKEAGECSRCTLPAIPGIRVCEYHQVLNRGYDRAVYEKRSKTDHCPTCGGPRDHRKKLHCTACIQLQNNELEQRRKEKGRVHQVYQLKFRDGAIYTGVTCQPLNKRLEAHQHNPVNWKLATRLHAGEEYQAEIVYRSRSRMAALETEIHLIEQCQKPLNQSGQPPTGNPPMARPLPGTYERPAKGQRRKARSERPARCSWCRERKPASAFASDRSRHNGLASRCRDCIKVYAAMKAKYRKESDGGARAYREAKEFCGRKERT